MVLIVHFQQMTPDENFFLDCHPKHHNIVIGAGFSGTYSAALACGWG